MLVRQVNLEKMILEAELRKVLSYEVRRSCRVALISILARKPDSAVRRQLERLFRM
jgi:hypothetical protein